MADDLDTTIEETATEPKSATVDGQTVVGRSVAEQVAADRYLQSKRASRSKRQGIRITKLVPPGAA